MLSTVGRSQIEVLGAWFAQRYVLSGALEAPSDKIHWRSSKSDRALESGYDFVKGFNDKIGSQVCNTIIYAWVHIFNINAIWFCYQVAGPAPLPYEVDADNYFRPWKVFKKEANAIKERANTDSDWAIKATENEGRLKEIFQQVNCLPSVLNKPTKALWCTTYLHALREVENFWPNDGESRRDAFCQALSADTQEDVTALALWVWEQRFLHCGFNCEMGGRISVDLVECALNQEHTLNIFSGHDYTLLSVFAALNLVEKFEKPTGFGAYLLFEVWERDGQLSFKITFNPDPFRCDDGHSVDMTKVNENNEMLLKECLTTELLTVVEGLKVQISSFPPPKEAKPPLVSTSVDNTDDFGCTIVKHPSVDLLS